jgi:hypothetical protein
MAKKVKSPKAPAKKTATKPKAPKRLDTTKAEQGSTKASKEDSKAATQDWAGRKIAKVTIVHCKS